MSDNAPIQEPVPPPEPLPQPEPEPQPAPAPAPEPAVEPAPEPAPAAKAKPSLQERVDRLTAARRAAEEDARYWRERALAAPAPQPAPEPAPQEPAKPDRATFADPDAYEAAIVEWASERAARRVLNENKQTDEQRRAVEVQQAQQRATQEEAEKLRDTWNERRAKFIEKTPDYVDVAEADDVPVSEVMAGSIMIADNGPEMAYWLGEHPEEARRIASMTRGTYPPGHQLAGRPMPDMPRQMFEMGKIAASLSAAPVRAPTAPAPINPVRSSASAVRKSPDEETMEEYAARRRGEMAARVH